jgi:RNA polymerase sigma-70 factor (ECF subfamily)
VDRETFDRLMLATLPAAQRFAVRLTGDPAAAEDLLHDALVRAAVRWRTFRGDAAFKAWFFQIVVNAFRDGLRRSGRRREVGPLDDDAPAIGCTDPATFVAGEEIGAIVARHVSALPPRQREVLVLVAYEELTPGEAARVLGITESNARANLHFARDRLKRQLAKHLGDVRREPSP